jgi:hypothetical protein
MAITDFSEDYCDRKMPVTRAEKRNRDGQLAQAEYTKRQEKRELKRAAIMARKEAAANQDEASATTEKPRKAERAKTPSDTSDKSGGEMGLEQSTETNDSRGREEEKPQCYSRTQQRKLSKRRQREESSHGGRRGKDRGHEDEEDDEKFAAEAERAAARRRAVWEAKEAAAEAALLLEAEKAKQMDKELQEQDLLHALQAEAANAVAATAGAFTAEQPPARTATQSRSRSRQREVATEAVVVVPDHSKSEVIDADLEGWEIL